MEIGEEKAVACGCGIKGHAFAIGGDDIEGGIIIMGGMVDEIDPGVENGFMGV